MQNNHRCRSSAASSNRPRHVHIHYGTSLACLAMPNCLSCMNSEHVDHHQTVELPPPQARYKQSTIHPSHFHLPRNSISITIILIIINSLCTATYPSSTPSRNPTPSSQLILHADHLTISNLSLASLHLLSTSRLLAPSQPTSLAPTPFSAPQPHRRAST